MEDQEKTREQLISELGELRQRVAELEALETWSAKRAEPYARARGEWERTFDVIPDPISIQDREHRIVWVNKTMANRLGITPEEAVGLTCWECVHGMKKPPSSCPHLKLLADGKEHMAEIHEKRLGGDFIVSVSPLHDGEGQVIGSIHVARDITKRKRAEQALQKAHDELEHRVEERTAEIVRASEKLRRSEEELRLLSSQLLKAEENERGRIARELHDGLGQSLSAIKFKLEEVLSAVGKRVGGADVESLGATISLVQNAVEEVRRITMDLRPSTLDDLGILATITWLSREFQKIYSTIKVEREIDIDENDVPESLKIIIFRILQEALNNAAKHSEADLVHLRLGKIDGSLELAVEDNGKGFEVEEALAVPSSERGFGLGSMRERTELLGGTFVIDSVKGRGTTVRASWPYKGLQRKAQN